MESTQWWDYVQALIGDDTFKTASNKAGFNQSAFSRWSKGSAADPAFAVKLARAYDANVLEALVAADFLTPEEAGIQQPDHTLEARELKRAIQTLEIATQETRDAGDQLRELIAKTQDHDAEVIQFDPLRDVANEHDQDALRYQDDDDDDHHP